MKVKCLQCLPFPPRQVFREPRRLRATAPSPRRADFEARWDGRQVRVATRGQLAPKAGGARE